MQHHARRVVTVDGAEVEAVRCDIQAYYAVLATITYPSGDVVYVCLLYTSRCV